MRTQRLLQVSYRGVRIVASECNGAWQARAVGIGALSAPRAAPRDAIDEIKRYLDEAMPR